jgi:hypothetical protein
MGESTISSVVQRCFPTEHFWSDFLLSGRAAYITGQLLQPNGGQATW